MSYVSKNLKEDIKHKVSIIELADEYFGIERKGRLQPAVHTDQPAMMVGRQPVRGGQEDLYLAVAPILDLDGIPVRPGQVRGTCVEHLFDGAIHRLPPVPVPPAAMRSPAPV